MNYRHQSVESKGFGLVEMWRVPLGSVWRSWYLHYLSSHHGLIVPLVERLRGSYADNGRAGRRVRGSCTWQDVQMCIDSGAYPLPSGQEWE